MFLAAGTEMAAFETVLKVYVRGSTFLVGAYNPSLLHNTPYYYRLTIKWPSGVQEHAHTP